MTDQKSLVSEEQLSKVNGGCTQETVLINEDESFFRYSTSENKKFIPGHNEPYLIKK